MAVGAGEGEARMRTALLISSLVCAGIPALLFLVNVRRYRRAPAKAGSRAYPAVSVLIPARDEELSIRAAVESVLANKGVTLECIVLDDHSSDRTAAIVRELSQHDPRLRLETAPALPPGWNGKQHACFVLSRNAKHDVLCFVDADVRLAPDALSRMLAFMNASGAPMVSGFPHQETHTWMEKLLLPLIHFVLLAFLPMGRMRSSRNSAYAAGCGQLMMVKRAAYRDAGGHAAIRTSMHDGIQLPRAFRRAGFATDLFDATDVAECRMYRNASEVWSGLAKNATEGLAAPARIGPFTVFLLLGQVAPFVAMFWSPLFLPIAVISWIPRFVSAKHFHQSAISALLHPVGILLLLAIQWYALTKKLLGRPSAWKSRAYAPTAVR
jgi:glycosyltransferase involved in cell wall biosynthesis